MLLRRRAVLPLLRAALLLLRAVLLLLFRVVPLLRDALARDVERDELPLRDLLDDARRADERRRDDGLRRSAAGISSCATAFASCGICFSRNELMRCSSLRIPLAS